MSYGNRELSYENRQSKQPYSFPFPSKQGQTYMGAWTPNIPKRNFFIYNITKTQDKMELGPPYFKSLPLLQN